MSFTKPISGATLAFLLFQGVIGNPVTKTAYDDYGSSSPTPTPTSSGYEGTWDACGNYSSPYGCPSPSSSATACPSICADYINECGMMYGGCFADPKCTGGTAWPTFAKPPCPTSSPTSSACPTICADYINDCGQMYGGCFPDPTCTGGTAWPTFSKPPCPTTTAITTASSSTKICSTTICSDYINSCGEIKSICFLDQGCTANGVFPTTFVPPPCTTATASKCNTICVDKVNSCGQKYGGCFPDPTCTGGTAWPSFSTPSCPSGTGSSSVYVTTVTPPAYPSTKIETDTVTSYTSIAPDTITVTSTSQTLIEPSSSAAGTAADGNGTRTSAVSPTAPTASPSAQPVFTGEAVRNRIGCAVVAVFVAVGAAFL